MAKYVYLYLIFLYCISICKGEEDSEDTDSATPVKIASAIFVAITMLIVVTIFFEWGKEKITSYASETMEPIVDTLFSEMTVLGFLSLVTFVISESGMFDDVSDFVFDNSEYLEDLFEQVHYLLFLVMVIFILEVILVVKLGNRAEKYWHQAQIEVTSEQTMEEHKRMLDEATSNLSPTMYLYRLFSHRFFGKYSKLRVAVHRFEFKSMRDEFIWGRDAEGKKAPSPEQAPDFDYARYLSLNLGQLLSSMVELPVRFWFFLWLCAFLFYLIDLTVTSTSDYFALSMVWLGIGYAEYLFMMVFSNKIELIRGELINPRHVPNSVRRYYREYRFPFPTKPQLYFLYPSANTSANSGKRKKARQSGAASGGASACASASVSWNSGGGGGGGDGGGGGGGARASGLGRSLLAEDRASATSINSNSNSNNNDNNNNDDSGDGGYSVDLEGRGRGARGGTGRVAFDAPGWCRYEPLQKERSPLLTYLYGGFPSSMMRIFWLENNGPKLHVGIFRFHLFFSSIHLSLILTEFADPVYEQAKEAGGTASGVLAAVAYVVVGLFPTVYMLLCRIDSLARRLVHVGSLGQLRKRNIEKVVVRQQKTERAIRTLMMLNSMRARAKGVKLKQSNRSLLDVREVNRRMEQEFAKAKATGRMCEKRKEQLEKIFDLYDRDKSGEVDASELRNMMTTLGFTMSSLELTALHKELDCDNSGEVSRNEFLLWHFQRVNEEGGGSGEGGDGKGGGKISASALVDELFALFPNDGEEELEQGQGQGQRDGEKKGEGKGQGTGKDWITSFSFCAGLRKLGADLTEEDMADLVLELDKDGDGKIDKDEFLQLLERVEKHDA